MMRFLKKKGSVIILIIGIVFVSGFFIAQWWARKHIETVLLQDIPPTISLQYSDLDINVLRGNISLSNPTISVRSENAKASHTLIQLEALQINGVGYWDLLVENKLSLNNVTLVKPNINHYPYHQIKNEKDKKNKKNGLEILKIDKFQILEGSLNVMRERKDSIKLSIANFDLKVNNTTVNLKSPKGIPFDLNELSLSAQNIISNSGAFEIFKIDSLNIDNKDALVKNLQIIPRYNKIAYSKHLKKERDYIKLIIPKINFEKIDLQLQNSRTLVAVDSIIIEQPNLEIYRDKLLPDDTTIKSLYSKSLRNLAFDLDINQIKINNAYISYAELIEANTKAGKLFFKNVNATLVHLSNLKGSKNTEIKVHSSFMGKAPLALNWSYDVNNKSDALFVNGSILNLTAADLNPFFTPNLNVKTEGELQQLYFTFSGNNTASKGEIKMKYDDFKFEILRKDSFKVNKLLTAVGNIFIKKDSDRTNKGDFRFGQIEAERDPTKSFFNYLWINVKSGVVSTLTGNGKKE